ncbi:MAG: hypothetical protein AAF560_28770 [Acidobacteriota bacterium]
MKSSGTLGPVELVADLNTTLAASGSRIDSWVLAGDSVYFLRALEGRMELWRTDGTAGATQLVRAVGRGTFLDSALRGGELPDGRLIFTAQDPATGEELWISDGSAEGTQFYAEICPGLCDAAPERLDDELELTHLGEEVVFQAQTVIDGPVRLMATAGDANGVRQVSERDIRGWTVSGDHLFLLEEADETAVWVSDGDAASESRLALPDVESVLWMETLGDRVVVQARTSSGPNQLYAGDAGGLELIANLGAVVFRDVAAGSNLLYLASTEQLWRSDGTAAGTFELPAVVAALGSVSDLRATEDRAFFFVGRERLWTSDGTPEGTLQVQSFEDRDFFSLAKLAAVDGELAFMVRGNATEPSGLWASDGTAEGTRQLITFEAIDFFPPGGPLGVLGDRLLFAADAGGTGLELWTSDLTEAGTRLVTNLTGDAASSNPKSLVRRSRDLAFAAGQGASADALFRYRAGEPPELVHVPTHQLSQVVTGFGDLVILEQRSNIRMGPTDILAVDPDSSSAVQLLEVSRVWASAVIGDRLFLATGFAEGSTERPFITDLWVSDGTPQGTVLLASIDVRALFSITFDMVAVSDRLFFRWYSEAAGTELWMTDGTPAGTRLVQDFEPGPESSFPRVLRVAGDRLYVHAEVGGSEPLFALDAEGSRLASVPLGDNSALRSSALASGRLFWTQGASDQPAVELWASDLGLASPSAIASLPGISILGSIGDRVMFSANGLDGSEELWLSDGTAEGTERQGSYLMIEAPVESGGQLFFAAASHAHGSELWVTNGTVAGTRLVADLQAGRESSQPEDLVAIDGGVLFSANTAAFGREPWSSNGEAAGTRRLGDIAPGPRSSTPVDFTALGETVVFSAYRDDVGRELFTLPRSTLAPSCTPGDASLCLNQGRFRVEVSWRDFEGSTGPGRPVPVPVEDSGLLYFFDPDNWEMLIKVLDGCAINNRYWVFAAATTDVEYTLTVTDTTNGERVQYFNPLGNASPAITDSDAFATCP